MKIIIGLVLFKNNLDVLLKNLTMLFSQSFFSFSDNSYQIIILDNDNGEQIAEIEAYLLSCPHKQKITLLKSENIGFGAGHNKIFNFIKSKTDFDYYLCLNPDGIPHYQMLEYLVGFAQKKDNNGIFESIQFPIEHPKIYDKQTKETKWCSACCCLFPFKVFNSLNGFDERFFMYMEDVDLSWRARAMGYKCYIIDDALFSHSVTNKERNESKQNIEMNKSGYKLAIKYINQEFANEKLEKLENLTTNDEINLLKISSGKVEIDDLAKYKNIVDFQHKFNFSEVRW